MRTFIAIEVPENIRSFFTELMPVKTLLEGVSIVHKDNFHITLKFLGEIEEMLISEIKQTLISIADETSSFTLKITNPGVFPDPLKPRVIWMGIENNSALIELVKKIEENLEKSGFQRETRKFKSHITLARVKNFRNGKYLFEKIEKNFKNKIQSVALKEGISEYQFSVKEFVLMKSTLTPHGSIYSVLKRFPLSK
ncbi:MAG TPA: RNA 2',3'-cyclic phosphodiesterase [Thermodesulfovibrio thiophilus]|uniref:RNA 2',3'-cyclic phosphodiesterase n=1 Tax=Thermodesulfovibrio thiophilus TaxID=340095 RepID=UPI0017FB91D4|nr:RNA 2',3'-cyclic phosphodiesterase [Thermodesulfovibrio thiophilus]HHW20115.1 RNA 2',3'-cyclic phosphodiesterase [Thermodesulfovibrio thiophilus]HOA83469.1 RNA 2',3'-cyclic phosphodiesterase [Thermodesulfovibrio thiophilus]HQA03882.1 RNA 2',3'-cyclic phosphodiesterase [Thermodesulfovibrio thiophilus]HQD35964.1 RNA 2',3'-cyclic phosphodiesterase [Thermodesulfovibrio thiophilus]